MTEDLNNYKFRGARALVLLHENHMRHCLEVWKEAKAENIKLPETKDEDYESLETLLRHVLDAARGYMVWVCDRLELPNPQIKPAPDTSSIEAEADPYLEHVLERWRLPLADIEKDRFHYPEYPSTSGRHHHCIEEMLEHAVMHPIRHAFQLEALLKQS